MQSSNELRTGCYINLSGSVVRVQLIVKLFRYNDVIIKLSEMWVWKGKERMEREQCEGVREEETVTKDEENMKNNKLFSCEKAINGNYVFH